jgi:hypothetical protein
MKREAFPRPKKLDGSFNLAVRLRRSPVQRPRQNRCQFVEQIVIPIPFDGGVYQVSQARARVLAPPASDQ